MGAQQRFDFAAEVIGTVTRFIQERSALATRNSRRLGKNNHLGAIVLHEMFVRTASNNAGFNEVARFAGEKAKNRKGIYRLFGLTIVNGASVNLPMSKVVSHFISHDPCLRVTRCRTHG